MTYTDVGIQHNDGGGGATGASVQIGHWPTGTVLTEVDVVGVKYLESETFTLVASSFLTFNHFHGLQVVASGGTVETVDLGPATGLWLRWECIDGFGYDPSSLVTPSSGTMGAYYGLPITLRWRGHVRNVTGADNLVYYTWGTNPAVGLQPVAKNQFSGRFRYSTWP